MQKVGKQSKTQGAVGFGDRISSAAAARKAQLEKWRPSKLDVNDPAVQEQLALRQAAAAAREERELQRKAEKKAAKAQAIADRKAAEEAAAAQLIADEEARQAA
ncbi:hypothetical protein CKO10_18405, partial [Rhodospirillum rubrum]|nr:hypothetical protein [Rhodospirillum rubrum]